MTGPRVHELGKDINVSSKVLIELLEQYDIKVKNHMTTLELDQTDVILTSYLNKYDDGSTIEEYYNKLHEAMESEKPKKAKTTKAEEEKPEQEETAEVEIVKEDTQKVVDTRQNTVDLEKLDIDKIEKLVDIDAEEKAEKKQKIKKNTQPSKKIDKKAEPAPKAKKGKGGTVCSQRSRNPGGNLRRRLCRKAGRISHGSCQKAV